MHRERFHPAQDDLLPVLHHGEAAPWAALWLHPGEALWVGTMGGHRGEAPGGGTMAAPWAAPWLHRGEAAL